MQDAGEKRKIKRFFDEEYESLFFAAVKLCERLLEMISKRLLPAITDTLFKKEKSVFSSSPQGMSYCNYRWQSVGSRRENYIKPPQGGDIIKYRMMNVNSFIAS